MRALDSTKSLTKLTRNLPEYQTMQAQNTLEKEEGSPNTRRMTNNIDSSYINNNITPRTNQVSA